MKVAIYTQCINSRDEHLNEQCTVETVDDYIAMLDASFKEKWGIVFQYPARVFVTECSNPEHLYNVTEEICTQRGFVFIAGRETGATSFVCQIWPCWEQLVNQLLGMMDLP